MDLDKIREEIAKHNWFHSIDFGNGIVTPSHYNTKHLLEKIRLPLDLSNKEIIDLGSSDGFFSFACEQRGAKRVLAVDHCFIADKNYAGVRPPTQAATLEKFNLAKEIFNSKVECLGADLHSVSSDTVGQFDITLFMGILYHVDNPIQVLKNTRSMTKELCILETHADLLDVMESTARFYPGTPQGRHWWGPNVKCIEAWALAAGFSRAEYLETWTPGSGRTGRVIFHLYP